MSLWCLQAAAKCAKWYDIKFSLIQDKEWQQILNFSEPGTDKHSLKLSWLFCLSWKHIAEKNWGNSSPNLMLTAETAGEAAFQPPRCCRKLSGFKWGNIWIRGETRSHRKRMWPSLREKKQKLRHVVCSLQHESTSQSPHSHRKCHHNRLKPRLIYYSGQALNVYPHDKITYNWML